MVNNIPVNGWPQLKDLEAVQPTLDRLDKIEAWKRTVKEETFTGDDITIENALALPARSLKTAINAIQDLHGLPFPYVGGAYKNKLPMNLSDIKAVNTTGTWSGNVYTMNGVAFTVNTNGTVTANDTATGGHAQIRIPVTGLSGDYYFDGCPSGGSIDKYDAYCWDATADARVKKWDGTTQSSSDYDSASLQQIKLPSEHDFWIVLRVFTGFTANNLVFKPMVCASTETDPTFAPYSNICPISGRTAAVITRSDGDEISEDFTIQLGQTVYGAEINWDTGVGTVKTAILAKNTADMDNNEDYPGWRNSGIRALVGGGINRIITGINTNCGTAYGVNTTGESGDVVLLPKDYYGGKTQTEWIALAMDIQIPATLATPTTIQLTPEQLEMLKGYNSITLSDGYGTIELKALTGANWS